MLLPLHRFLLLLILPQLLAACKEIPAEEAVQLPPAPTLAPAPVAAPTPPPVPCPLPAYTLENLQDKPRLSEQQVQALVRRTPQLPAFFQAYNAYSDVVLLDTLHCPNFRLLSVLWRHEECCEDIYFVTTSLDGRRVQDSVRVAAVGMDGGWHAQATMRTTPTGELLVTAREENASDAGDGRSTLDSAVTAYSVSAQGKFQQKQLSRGQRTMRTGEHLPMPEKP